MKKAYREPATEIVSFEPVDIITISGIEDTNGGSGNKGNGNGNNKGNNGKGWGSGSVGNKADGTHNKHK